MRIGFVSFPVSGHLNPMTALARRLQARGHDVVFFGVPDVEPFARAAGLTFVSFCENEYPAGAVSEIFKPVANLHGIDVVTYTSNELFPGFVQAALENLGEKIEQTGVEALVLDTVYFFLQLVPISLGIPYVHIWNILHIDFSGMTPPCYFSFPCESTPEALSRNVEGLKVVGELLTPIVAVAQSYAKKVGLQIDWNNPTATMSPLAVVTQTPREFDFRGSPWPVQFHYAGPFYDNEGREIIPFPWERLADKPIIYASLGTLVNGLEFLYNIILDAVGRLPEVQVVLSVGKNVNLGNLRPLPQNVIVVRAAPQIELLKRASLCITHAGLNTTLESLGQGVPIVAIPIGYDQPGVAARIAHHGVGEFIEIANLTTENLQALLLKVLDNRGYQKNARHFQKVIARTRGLDIAAEVIEQAFEKETNATLKVGGKQNGDPF